MIKNNNWKAFLSSLLILLPMVGGFILWDKLPASMAIHWGADGAADGFGTKLFAIVGIPLILLAIHWLCLGLTTLDPKQKMQHPKVQGILFWIIPIIALFAQSITYGVALGKTSLIETAIPLLLGVLFLTIGNYLPKVVQNSTMGVRIYWTLHNEENWRKTHRFAGRLWVIGGVVMLLTVLLPIPWMFAVMLLDILVMVLAPVIYSYGIYRKHKASGIAYTAKKKTKGQTLLSVIAFILIIALLAGVSVVMFTGDIHYSLDPLGLFIGGTYMDTFFIPFEDIDEVLYFAEYDPGIRTFGFGSARLLMGTFQNETWGTYTLYGYRASESAILIRSGEKLLVLTGKNAPETSEMFIQLTRIGGFY